MKQYQLIILGSANVLTGQAYEMYSRSTTDSIRKLRSKQKLRDDYTGVFCLFEGEEGESQSCWEHTENLAIGNKWYQYTAEDEDTVNYYQWRIMPFARGELDWHPYLQIKDLYYQDFTATVLEFDAAFFGELQVWWNYEDFGSDTRDLCWGYGYDIEDIDIDVIINLWIKECYKTLLDNLEDPFGSLDDFFTWECSESTTQDVNFYVNDYYEDADSTYLEGAEPNSDTHGDADKDYCLNGLFSKNKMAADLFDIGV